MAFTRSTRVLSVLAATSLAIAPAVPAAAQPSSTAPEASQATPPPLPANFPVPPDTDGPDQTYTPSRDCVQSRGSTVQLDEKPWGQDLLQFDEIERFGVTGAGQTVAVIDTGVTPHDYLAGRLDGGGDYVVAGENGLRDCDGHGTEVAGIIAADPKNDAIGFRGIAPGARILSIRQSSGNYEFKDPATNETQAAGNLGTLARSIVRAANKGATVINMSVDSCRPVQETPIFPAEQQVQSALRYAVEVKNVVVVASAGNVGEAESCPDQNGPDPQNPTVLVIPPWFSDYVLSVAAMDEQGAAAEFSINGPWVSVAAPGTDIISLDPAKTDALANQTVDENNKVTPIQGTSFAAPYVAGLAALVRQQYPNLTAKQVMNRIKTTASHPAATGGHNNLVGYGMINPIAALTAFIPAEENIPPDQAIEVPFEMPPAYERDWTPMQVAMIGSGGGLGLLLLTLFVVHTVRRNRQDPEEANPRNRH